MSSPLRGLYAITDSQLLAGGRLLPYAEAALIGGARLLQYRDKSADARPVACAKPRPWPNSVAPRRHADHQR